MSAALGELLRIGALAVTVGMSVLTDIACGKIYNKVVLTAVPVGILIWGAAEGWPGVLKSLSGIAVGSIALLFAGGLKWIAPGDAKLIVAIGALMGAAYVGWAMLFGAVAGGVLALMILAKRRLLKTWLWNTAAAWTARLPLSTFWAERSGYLPYSVPIAVGCAAAALYLY